MTRLDSIVLLLRKPLPLCPRPSDRRRHVKPGMTLLSIYVCRLSRRMGTMLLLRQSIGPILHLGTRGWSQLEEQGKTTGQKRLESSALAQHP